MEGILARRRQLVDMLTAEKNRPGSATKPVAKRIAGHVGWLEKELERTDRDLDRAIKGSPTLVGVAPLNHDSGTLRDDQKVKSLTHELAHHLLHRDAPLSEAERPTLEAEAEGTAYAVLSYFGVDASGYSFAYVAHWAEQKEIVKTVLSNIQKAARAIIEAVEDGQPQAEVSLDRGAA